MPSICRFYGIVIWIYWSDHNPPHFHAEYGEHEILIKIDDLSIYTGYFPSRAFGLLMEWALLHKEELMKNWSLAQRDLQLNKIEPLK
jgi:phosphomannomutase